MIAIILALETEATARCIDHAAKSLIAGGISVATVHAETLQDLTERLLGAGQTRTIAVLHRLDAHLAGILADLDRPLTLLHTDPILAALSRQAADSTQDSASTPGHDPLGAAVRDTMRRLSTFVRPQSYPTCLTLDADSENAPALLLDRLLDALEARPEWSDPALPTPPFSHPPAAALDPGSEDALMLRGALAGFDSMREGHPPARFVISRRLFADATAAGAPVGGPIDATGRRQILVYGPYVHVPPGTWHVRLVLDFSPGVRDVPFLVDVAAQRGADIRARTTFTVDHPGRREITFAFLHERPNVPIEFRIFSERAIFDGQMALGYIDLRQGDPEAEPEALPAQLSEA